MHPQRMILPFNVRRANAVHVRHSADNHPFNFDDFRRTIAQCGLLDINDPQPAITVMMPDEDQPRCKNSYREMKREATSRQKRKFSRPMGVELPAALESFAWNLPRPITAWGRAYMALQVLETASEKLAIRMTGA